jgi:hypothetical protein
MGFIGPMLQFRQPGAKEITGIYTIKGEKHGKSN